MERRVAKTPETMVGIGIDMQFVVKTCGQTLFQRAHQFGWRTVSYTHLTLPTIYSV